MILSVDMVILIIFNVKESTKVPRIWQHKNFYSKERTLVKFVPLWSDRLVMEVITVQQKNMDIVIEDQEHAFVILDIKG